MQSIKHPIDFIFSQRLEQFMIAHNLYPKDVERLTGIKRRKIYEYIQGQHQPSAYAVKRIAEGLNVSADWLLDIKNSATKGTDNLV